MLGMNEQQQGIVNLLHDHGIQPRLCGSRYYGNQRVHSDFDLWITQSECDTIIDHVLKTRNFEPVSVKEYQYEGTFLGTTIYRNTRIDIDIQIIDDRYAPLKKHLERCMRQLCQVLPTTRYSRARIFGMWISEYKNSEKLHSYLIWNELLGDGGLTEDGRSRYSGAKPDKSIEPPQLSYVNENWVPLNLRLKEKLSNAMSLLKTLVWKTN